MGEALAGAADGLAPAEDLGLAVEREQPRRQATVVPTDQATAIGVKRSEPGVDLEPAAATLGEHPVERHVFG